MRSSVKHKKNSVTIALIIVCILVFTGFFLLRFVFLDSLIGVFIGYDSESDQTNISTIDFACKDTHYRIESGLITNKTQDYYGEYLVWAPDENASQSERKEAADKATVIQAMKYHGIDNLSLDHLCYSVRDIPEKKITRGNIFCDDPQAHHHKKPEGVECRRLSYDTALGEMYAE